MIEHMTDYRVIYYQTLDDDDDDDDDDNDTLDLT